MSQSQRSQKLGHMKPPDDNVNAGSLCGAAQGTRSACEPPDLESLLPDSDSTNKARREGNRTVWGLRISGSHWCERRRVNEGPQFSAAAGWLAGTKPSGPAA